MPKLTVATTFPLLPAHDGGRARVLGLYGAVASLGVDVDVVTFGPRDERPRTTVVRPGLREIRIPQSAAHYAAELDLRAGRHTAIAWAWQRCAGAGAGRRRILGNARAERHAEAGEFRRA